MVKNKIVPFTPQNKAPAPSKVDKVTVWSPFRETLDVIVMIFIVLVVQTFFLTISWVPSSSMAPNMLPGDVAVATKYDFGWNVLSLPVSLPALCIDAFNLNQRNLPKWYGRSPERGAVIVFKDPNDPRGEYFTKRVIGVAGDTLQMVKGVVVLNGQPLQQKRLGPYKEIMEYDRPPMDETLFEETLPGDENLTYTIARDERYTEAPINNTPVYIIPEGHVFCMGDHRDQSADCRYQDGLAFVPITHVVGRVRLILISSDKRGWMPLDMVRSVWSRISRTLTIIH